MAKAHEAPVTRSRRVPHSLEPNAWTRRLFERRAAGARLLDLTDMNPTGLGLIDGAEVAACAQRASNDPRAARYQPDPRGLLSARQAIATYFGSRGTPVEPSAIVLTSGTSESYAHLFRLLASPGETVLVPAPSYPLFEPIATVAGTQVAHYRLAYDGAWHLDAESVERAFRGSSSPVRAVVVVQPNHPTGSCLAADELVILEELCRRYGAALISDEVFGDFPWPRWGDRREPAPLPSLLGERGVPTFVLGGLSKCCGLPQYKLGWIATCGPDEPVRELIEGLEWIADLFLSVATHPQLALPDLLELRHGFQSRVQARIAENLQTLKSAVQQDHSQIGLLDGRGGWAAILTMPSRRSGEEWALALLDREVSLHPDHFYDLEGTALVVSLIVEPDVLRAALDRLLNLLTTS